MSLYSSRPLMALVLGSLLLSLGGCAKTATTSSPTSSPSTHQGQSEAPSSAQSGGSEPEDEVNAVLIAGDSTSSCIAPEAVLRSEANRASCFRLQPARTVLVKKATGKKSKSSSGKGLTKTTTSSKSTKKSATTASKTGKTSKATTTPAPVVERTVGLCQPQSLIYARCRTGIKTCQMGDTSPMQWFACARKNGATTATPVAGSVIIIDTHRERNMDTGHPAYVEEAHRNADGTWKLRISHTNYDRKCHLDLDAQVLFDPRTMTATFQSGPWAPWAHRLRVLGFILR